MDPRSSGHAVDQRAGPYGRLADASGDEAPGAAVRASWSGSSFDRALVTGAQASAADNVRLMNHAPRVLRIAVLHGDVTGWRPTHGRLCADGCAWMTPR